MASFTADTVSYGGASFDGVTFEILPGAYQKKNEDEDGNIVSNLIYHCRVTLADGSDVSVLGWQNIKAAPDFSRGPQADALVNAKARAEAIGATNIEDVA